MRSAHLRIMSLPEAMRRISDLSRRYTTSLCACRTANTAPDFILTVLPKIPQLVTQPGYVRDKAYLALIAGDTDIPAGIEKVNEKGKIYAFTQKNKLFAGDTVEILSPGRTGRSAVLAELYDTDGNAIESTPHPNMLYFARLPFDADTGDIVRAH